jgi:hypothetical protein
MSLDSLVKVATLKPKHFLPDIDSGKKLLEVPNLLDRLSQLKLIWHMSYDSLLDTNRHLQHFLGKSLKHGQTVRISKAKLEDRRFIIDQLSHDPMLATSPIDCLAMVIAGNDPDVRSKVRAITVSDYPESNPTVRVGMSIYAILDALPQSKKDLYCVPISLDMRYTLGISKTGNTKPIKVTPYAFAETKGSSDCGYEEFRFNDVKIDVLIQRIDRHPQNVLKILVRSICAKESPKYIHIGDIVQIKNDGVKFVQLQGLSLYGTRVATALARLGITQDLLRHRNVLTSMPKLAMWHLTSQSRSHEQNKPSKT